MVSRLWSLAKNYFTAGIVGLTISDRYASFMAVRGSSMFPTLNPHEQISSSFTSDDYVLVEKLCLEKFNFSHGDVVVFRMQLLGIPRQANYSPTSHKEKNIKRITALPGDWIQLSSFDAIKIPSGHCWVEGDNTASSRDSRTFGPIPLGLICGRVTHVVWPPQRMGRVERRITMNKLPI